MKKKLQPQDFDGYIHCEVTIECQKCKKIEGDYDMDEWDFAKILIKKGWKISSRDTLYCPKCAKKYLKTESK